MAKKVLLGMSGGVDSSVSAILLQKQGYQVIGATMRLWESNNLEKGKNDKSIQDAKKVCEKLGIEHKVFDLREEFKNDVVKNFLEQYENGKTPNPCVECNKCIKFGAFFEIAEKMGISKVATGHYAKIEYSNKYNQKVILRANEQKKDQTYFLYYIPREKIENIIFPLQDYNTKEEIRKIALENNLEVATKRDSQEICFIDEQGYQQFLTKCGKIRPRKGKIILKDGTILGEHMGYVNYTIGQRKGLKISYKEPLYVIGLDPKKNEVIVGTEKDLYKDFLFAKDINWQVPKMQYEGKILYAKVRYRANIAKCKIEKIEKEKAENEKVKSENTESERIESGKIENEKIESGKIENEKIESGKIENGKIENGKIENERIESKEIGSEKIKIKFEKPQRAITPGQSVVFYDEEGVLIGGGIIE